MCAQVENMNKGQVKKAWLVFWEYQLVYVDWRVENKVENLGWDHNRGSEIT